VGEQQAHGVRTLIVERPEQRVAPGDAGSGFEQQADDGAVGDLAGVVQRLVVVGVGARLQQSPCKGDVVVATGCAIQNAERIAGQFRISPLRIRIRARGEQQVHAFADAWRVGGQGDQSREGGAGQRRHAVRGAGRIGPGRVGRDGGSRRSDVADGAGERRLAGQQVGMFAQEALGQCRLGGLVAVAESPSGPLVLSRDRVGRCGLQRDIVLQLRPRVETVFARDAGLRVVQAQPHRGDRGVVEPGGGGQGEANAFERIESTLADAFEQPLGLLPQMIRMRTGGKILHGNLHAITPKVRNPGCTKVGGGKRSTSGLHPSRGPGGGLRRPGASIDQKAVKRVKPAGKLVRNPLALQAQALQRCTALL